MLNIASLSHINQYSQMGYYVEHVSLNSIVDMSHSQRITVSLEKESSIALRFMLQLNNL